MGKSLDLNFYLRNDVVVISREPLDNKRFTCSTDGTITKTEAYHSSEDRACHAYGDRRTKRTETMCA